MNLFLVEFFRFATSIVHAYPILDEDTLEILIESNRIMVECDASVGDERGPFGINFQDGKIRYDLLVMTGVYFDTCKDLERKVKKMKRKHNKIVLIATEKFVPDNDPNNYIWRWRSARTIDGKECISYFENDCLDY